MTGTGPLDLLDVSRLLSNDERDIQAAVRESVNRGRPFGDDAWARRTADRLGLAHTMRRPGRPAKQKDDDPVQARRTPKKADRE